MKEIIAIKRDALDRIVEFKMNDGKIYNYGYDYNIIPARICQVIFCIQIILYIIKVGGKFNRLKLFLFRKELC